MHVDAIANLNNTDANKLGDRSNHIMRRHSLIHATGRVLRYLATNHIFKETAPDVFAHNKISSTLDTGKSIEAILAE